MKSSSFILFPSDTTWTIVAPDGRELEATDAAGAVAMLRPGQLVMLALPSAWCLPVTFDSVARDRKAALFQMEEKLPVAAEDVTADIVSSGRKSMGVCVRTDRLRDLVKLVESSGARVQMICPAAMLAAQAVADGSLLHLQLNGCVDVVALVDGRPLAWGWSSGSEEDVRVQTRVVSQHLSDPDSITAKRMDDARRLAIQTARLCLEGRLRPWFDLRRDAVATGDSRQGYRRSLNFALAGAAALLLAIAAVALVRAARFNAAARLADAEMIQQFRGQFPSWPVPASVRAVVQSERRKLSEGQSASTGSPLSSMRDLIAAMPATARVSIEAMSFDAASFEMRGMVNEQSNLDALTAAVRSAGFDVAAPQSRREAGGEWSFNISGTRPRLAERRPPP